jgi:hypothetical protein
MGRPPPGTPPPPSLGIPSDVCAGCRGANPWSSRPTRPRSGAIRTRKSFFNWQVPTDGGLTWVTLPSTGKCKTSVANLTSLIDYSFRVALSDASGVMGEWSQVVRFLVH